MKTIATALEAYATDQNFYPAAAALALPSGLSLPTTTIGAISGAIHPTYIRAIPLADGWNSFFLYGANASKTDYAVCSAGADGIQESSPMGGSTTTFNSDIIFVDGTFVQFPEGVQR
ncbi:MAG: type II secretion system protein GspG [Thermoanaerobaculia bacterium]|nr:type II secretion system protein GspG [Thermoanaerobaculia bacterium]